MMSQSSPLADVDRARSRSLSRHFQAVALQANANGGNCWRACRTFPVRHGVAGLLVRKARDRHKPSWRDHRLMFPPSPGNLFTFISRALPKRLPSPFSAPCWVRSWRFRSPLSRPRTSSASVFVHFLSRRFLDTIRGVDTLIWALIFINVVGLGPFAGILAVAMSDVGSFGKLFSEAIETADTKPVDGVTSTGGSALHQIRFGIVPQVLPVILSQVLYYFEFKYALGDRNRHCRCGWDWSLSFKRDQPAELGPCLLSLS